jgi:hypothetical protein
MLLKTIGAQFFTGVAERAQRIVEIALRVTDPNGVTEDLPTALLCMLRRLVPSLSLNLLQDPQ